MRVISSDLMHSSYFFSLQLWQGPQYSASVVCQYYCALLWESTRHHFSLTLTFSTWRFQKRIGNFPDVADVYGRRWPLPIKSAPLPPFSHTYMESALSFSYRQHLTRQRPRIHVSENPAYIQASFHNGTWAVLPTRAQCPVRASHIIQMCVGLITMVSFTEKLRGPISNPQPSVWKANILLGYHGLLFSRKQNIKIRFRFLTLIETFKRVKENYEGYVNEGQQ